MTSALIDMRRPSRAVVDPAANERVNSLDTHRSCRAAARSILQPGQWTDGTSMALCLGESLVRCHGFDPKDQMERYVRWWQEHLVPAGNRTRI
jgi:ADP-ribosylglycohydrolase